jgi:hypothetical protein
VTLKEAAPILEVLNLVLWVVLFVVVAFLFLERRLSV